MLGAFPTKLLALSHTEVNAELSSQVLYELLCALEFREGLAFGSLADIRADIRGFR